MGFDTGPWAIAFSILSAVCVTGAYAFIGGAWLLMKTTGDLQRRVTTWSKRSLLLLMAGIASVSIVNPLVSDAVYEKWFNLPEAILLMPIPLLCGLLLFGAHLYLRRFHLRTNVSGSDVPTSVYEFSWLPFAAAVVVFTLCFQGLAYSFYPYIVPFEITVWEAAAATESLLFVFWGVALVFPVIIGYTLFSYRVFWGKAEALRYY